MIDESSRPFSSSCSGEILLMMRDIYTTILSTYNEIINYKDKETDLIFKFVFISLLSRRICDIISIINYIHQKHANIDMI